jgi:hypothetical protein
VHGSNGRGKKRLDILSAYDYNISSGHGGDGLGSLAPPIPAKGGLMDKDGIRWTGVDLDGTLAHAEDGWPEPDQIGEPIPGMMEWVKRAMTNGITIKIFTARASWPESLPHVKEWLTKHGIGHLEITNIKDMYCDRILDDKAIQVLRNSGHIVGIHPAEAL